jgi:hypothetical protein
MKNRKEKSMKIRMMWWNVSGEIFLCHVDKKVPQTKIQANFVPISENELISLAQNEKNQ